MKFKLIQMGILFSFVMSVVFLAQTPNRFGHPAGDHLQNKWIDGDQHSENYGEFVQSTQANATDPRNRSFDKIICGKNGGNGVLGKGWYYRGGKLSGATDGNRDHDANDTSPIHQVYELFVNSSAYANSILVFGAVSPGIAEVNALPVQNDRFGGSATIKLDIFETSYHEEQYSYLNPFLYVGCKESYVKAQYVHPQAETIEIVVKTIEIDERETEEHNTGVNLTLGGEISSVGADLSAKYIKSWTSSRTDLYGYGYGIYDILYATEPKQRYKKSLVEGEMEQAMSVVYAEYDGEEMCPEPNVYSDRLVPRGDFIHLKKYVLW